MSFCYFPCVNKSLKISECINRRRTKQSILITTNVRSCVRAPVMLNKSKHYEICCYSTNHLKEQEHRLRIMCQSKATCLLGIRIMCQSKATCLFGIRIMCQRKATCLLGIRIMCQSKATCLLGIRIMCQSKATYLLGIRIMCQSKATCLLADCCFRELVLWKPN
jgi:hypothetical protein